MADDEAPIEWSKDLRAQLERDEAPGWVEDHMLGLLLRDPNLHVCEPPEWFDDTAPDAYVMLSDAGLITGIDYEYEKGRGLSIEVGDVRLTDAGRAIGERALRRKVLGGRESRVFVSYIREDLALVDDLCMQLEAAGIPTWRDTERLLPGDQWARVIREKIRTCSAFIACFSLDSERRERTVMRDELWVAIDELRLRSPDSGWFIPVMLTECMVPDYPISADRTLRDLHFIRLFEKPTDSFQKLIEALDRLHLP